METCLASMSAKWCRWNVEAGCFPYDWCFTQNPIDCIPVSEQSLIYFRSFFPFWCAAAICNADWEQEPVYPCRLLLSDISSCSERPLPRTAYRTFVATDFSLSCAHVLIQAAGLRSHIRHRKSARSFRRCSNGLRGYLVSRSAGSAVRTFDAVCLHIFPV